MFNFKGIELKDFKKIIEIIEDCEDTKLDVNMSVAGNNIFMMSSEQETELYIKKSLDSIIISRVNFKNKRKGIMTKVLNELINLTKYYGYNKIIVESVLTEEMSKFCIKNNFIQKPNYFGEFDGYMGDYEFILS